MKRGKIIILEGTSCVGKTTLCLNLQKMGWIIIPEAIRYLEKETQKSGDEASPIPNVQAEEEYFQNELFRIELQKIREANYYSNNGYNVVIDKSAIATIATAKAFEKIKGFTGTFNSACSKYYAMKKNIIQDGLIECDAFLLLTSDYQTIIKRNINRNHILEGIWLNEETIIEQRKVLEFFCNNVIGKISDEKILTGILDTTNLDKFAVLNSFLNFVNKIESLKSNEEVKK